MEPSLVPFPPESGAIGSEPWAEHPWNSPHHQGFGGPEDESLGMGLEDWNAGPDPMADEPGGAGLQRSRSYDGLPGFYGDPET
jgi:hypothetical protein